MPRSANETPQSQFRLSLETLAELDLIRETIGANSRAEVVRQAVREMRRRLRLPAPKKIEKSAG